MVENNERYLNYFNFRNSKTWRFKFSNKFSEVLHMSDNEDVILFQDGSKMICINKNSDILWEKENIKTFGSFDFSFDNKYLLWLKGLEYSLIDAYTGNYLVQDREIIFKKSKGANQCSFIGNTYNFAMPTLIDKEVTAINCYDIKGDIYKTFVVQESLISSFYVESINATKHIIYFDNKIVAELNL